MINTKTEFNETESTEQLNSAASTFEPDDPIDKEAPDITPMTQSEARKSTEQIRKGLEGIKSVPQRLLSMEQRLGFSALGYETWREWAKSEYPHHSQGYLYRLLSAAKAKVNLDFDPTIVEIDIPVSHLYQLSRLPDDQQTFAYHQANELAEILHHSQ